MQTAVRAAVTNDSGSSSSSSSSNIGGSIYDTRTRTSKARPTPVFPTAPTPLLELVKWAVKGPLNRRSRGRGGSGSGSSTGTGIGKHSRSLHHLLLPLGVLPTHKQEAWHAMIDANNGHCAVQTLVQGVGRGGGSQDTGDAGAEEWAGVGGLEVQWRVARAITGVLELVSQALMQAKEEPQVAAAECQKWSSGLVCVWTSV
jgi:hypothetical protein